MKGIVPLISPSFNPAVSIETRPEHLSAETGARLDASALH